MALGRRLPLSALAIAAGIAPLLAGCGLLDRGSTLDDALAYVPADTSQVRFSDRGSWAERLGVDDLDPRDLSDDDVDDYLQAGLDEGRDAVAATQLTPWLQSMKAAPFNDLDIEWEASATWAEPDHADETASATVWKVGDDLDFEALASDLEDKGYEKQGAGESTIYTIDLARFDGATGLVDGTYPLALQNVLLAEDEKIIAATTGSPGPLADIADVVGDDADSLADADDDRVDDLVDAVEDPEVALIATAGPAVCATTPTSASDDQGALVDALGRPRARALFVTHDDDKAKATLVLQYDDEDAAKAEVDPRKSYIEDGLEGRSRRSFADLGDFDVEQDGDLLLIDERWHGGTSNAITAEQQGGGPGICPPEAG